MTRINCSVVIAMLLVFVFGCKKADIRHVNVASARFQVAKIVYSPCCGIHETMIFMYNKMGDPVSIKHLPEPKTGAPDYLFRYDQKHRLTELRCMYTGGVGGETYHKYFYANPGNSNIILDSIYAFPVFQNDVMFSYHSASASYLFYDSKGRIIKDSLVNDGGYNTTVVSYYYTAAGNLQGRSYDDKLNIHQTNRIWMFLDRDYSINNPFVAASYNRQGLPTSINLTGETRDYVKFITFMRTANIEYQVR